MNKERHRFSTFYSAHWTVSSDQMASATVLTLLVIPAVFLLWKRMEFKNARPRLRELAAEGKSEA